MIALLALLLQVSGDATIRAQAGKSELVIRTTSRLAGAIDSLQWDGKEFINSTDHGRQLQSASNLDAGSPISDETYNPTEAGSRADHVGPRSSSVLLSLKAEGNTLETRSKMAFWLRPGELSGKNPAKNTTVVSEHVLAKKVTIGVGDLSQVVEYVATFTLPAGEHHTAATFEAVTGYMPAEFSRFLAYDPGTQKAVPIGDGPGEQKRPLIFATEDGRHAMGIYSPETGVSYGRFKFAEHRVVKWNCVFRVAARDGIPPGDFRYRTYIPVGTLEDVVASMRRLPAVVADRK
jgi:hypothetical protein